ncbi:MAG: autotransporter outer membrane beta-barrel domain-containing protein [Methylobacteriaceae bacterium]|jgi:fibronectin-binding autotransporter adhesin|nr:autotransporter outer membrane beta-barrel domain-containing protein [Methylobacteriaceae bacterium]
MRFHRRGNLFFKNRRENLFDLQLGWSLHAQSRENVLNAFVPLEVAELGRTTGAWPGISPAGKKDIVNHLRINFSVVLRAKIFFFFRFPGELFRSAQTMSHRMETLEIIAAQRPKHRGIQPFFRSLASGVSMCLPLLENVPCIGRFLKTPGLTPLRYRTALPFLPALSILMVFPATAAPVNVTLQGATPNSSNGIAFEVPGGGGAVSSLTVKADHSSFSGEARIAADYAQLNLVMVNGSEWQEAHGVVSNLTLSDSRIRFFPPAGSAFSTLTITGDYIGNDGHIYMHTAFGDESSPSDLLHIGGNTSGTTTLHVSGFTGTGVPTTADGIRVVQVDGLSSGVFDLAGDYVTTAGEEAVIAGAFAYTLWKSGGDWYLHSEPCPANGCTKNDPPCPAGPLYQPYAPVAEAYVPTLMASVMEMETFGQRARRRPEGVWTGVPGSAQAYRPVQTAVDGALKDMGEPFSKTETPIPFLWVDVRGSADRFEPAESSTGVSTHGNGWQLRGGLDVPLLDNDTNSVTAGVNAAYGSAAARTDSWFGNGSIDTERYGFGMTLTWMSDSGLYVDVQEKTLWFDSDLSSEILGQLATGASAFGWAFSVEGGRELAVSDAWSLVSQAQLTYGSLDVQSFNDRFGNRYVPGNAERLRGRLGLAAERHAASVDQKGETAENRFYGIGNLFYEFFGSTTLSLAGTDLKNDTVRLWSGLGLGFSHSWAAGRYRIFIETDSRTSLEHFADSWAITGQAGFAFKW